MQKSKLSNFKLQIALTFSIVLLLSGCQISRGLRAVMSKKVKPQYYTLSLLRKVLSNEN